MLEAKVRVDTDKRNINAFADDDDNVGVYGGLVHHMGTDAEIAGVLAHEFAHIMYGHVGKKKINAIVGGLIFGSLALAASVGSGEDGQQLIRDATELGWDIGSTAYSPEMEIEADRTAVYILHKAGLPAHRPAKRSIAHDPYQGGSFRRRVRGQSRLPRNASEQQPPPGAPGFGDGGRAGGQAVEACERKIGCADREWRRLPGARQQRPKNPRGLVDNPKGLPM